MGYTIYFSTIRDITPEEQTKLHQAGISFASHLYHNCGHAYTVIKDRGDYLQAWTTADNAESFELSYSTYEGSWWGGFCKTFRRDFTVWVAAMLAYAGELGLVVYGSDDDECATYVEGLLLGKELALAEASAIVAELEGQQAELARAVVSLSSEHVFSQN